MFQFYNLITNINVEENIILPLLLDGKKMRDYQKQLNHILEVSGLAHRRKHMPRQLSGGQQRAAIARALIIIPQTVDYRYEGEYENVIIVKMGVKDECPYYEEEEKRSV